MWPKATCLKEIHLSAFKEFWVKTNTGVEQSWFSCLMILQEPIEIMSSDEETEKVNPPKQEGQSADAADVNGLRRSARNNAWQSTSAKYEVCFVNMHFDQMTWQQENILQKTLLRKSSENSFDELVFCCCNELVFCCCKEIFQALFKVSKLTFRSSCMRYCWTLLTEISRHLKAVHSNQNDPSPS